MAQGAYDVALCPRCFALEECSLKGIWGSAPPLLTLGGKDTSSR